MYTSKLEDLNQSNFLRKIKFGKIIVVKRDSIKWNLFSIQHGIKNSNTPHLLYALSLIQNSPGYPEE